jgi:hypothetical protein
MNEPIDLRFRYDKRDYVRAWQTHCASLLHLPWDIVAIVAVAGGGVYLWSSGIARILGQVGVGGACAVVLSMIATYTVIPRLAFRRELRFREEYSLGFSLDGVHFRCAGVDSRIQWSWYSRALIDADSYLLYYGPRRYTFIPKRVFASTEQQLAFEQLLAEKLPQVVRRDR